MLNLVYISYNFKNTPKVSEYTSLVINYVLFKILIIIVLDNWILCCGRYAVTLALHRCDWSLTPSQGELGSSATNESLQFSLCKECY